MTQPMTQLAWQTRTPVTQLQLHQSTLQTLAQTRTLAMLPRLMKLQVCWQTRTQVLLPTTTLVMTMMSLPLRTRTLAPETQQQHHRPAVDQTICLQQQHSLPLHPSRPSSRLPSQPVQQPVQPWLPPQILDGRSRTPHKSSHSHHSSPCTHHMSNLSHRQLPAVPSWLPSHLQQVLAQAAERAPVLQRAPQQQVQAPQEQVPVQPSQCCCRHHASPPTTASPDAPGTSSPDPCTACRSPSHTVVSQAPCRYRPQASTHRASRRTAAQSPSVQLL
jgi:hypothetical protein